MNEPEINKIPNTFYNPGMNFRAMNIIRVRKPERTNLERSVFANDKPRRDFTRERAAKKL